MGELTLTGPHYLTRKEAARRLDVSLSTLRNLVMKGELHPIRQGLRWVRYRLSDLDEYLALKEQRKEALALQKKNWWD